jgi:nicotinate-nucleotide adenylyltransferase
MELTGLPSGSSGKSLRLGVFGGSFDPIHNGHLTAAAQVKEALGLHSVLFVPAGNQWQKAKQTSSLHRLEMTKLAVDGIPGFEVSSIDVDRSGPTYSVDTLSELGRIFPDAQLFFIIGTDALAGLGSWKSAERLFDLAQLVVVNRPGSSLLVPEVAVGRVQEIPIDGLDLSSTQVRDLLLAGGDASGLVPASVLRYIEEHNLYREPELLQETDE